MIKAQKIRFAVTPPASALTEAAFEPYLERCEALGFDTLWLSDIPLGTQGDQVMLVVQRRTRPDKAHVANENAPQLRQLVKTRSPQKRTHRRQERLRVRQQMRGHGRRPETHAAKLRHSENPVVPAYAIRPVECRAARGQPDQQGKQTGRHTQQKRGEAAKILGIPRRTFYNRLKALGIEP